MELINKFWKHASKTNAVDNIENIFIKWAAKEKLSIDEFNTIYTEIDNQIYEYFNKKGSFSIEQNGQTLKFDTMEDYNNFISNQQQPTPQENKSQENIPQESDLNKQNSPENSPDSPNDIDQQPIEKEPPVGQPHIGEDTTTENISETNPEENKTFPLLDIIGS